MRLLSPSDLYPAGAGQPAFALIDVRAPVEVARGALPRSHNLPILDDGERHLVGIRYKEAGPEAAFALGEALTRAAMPERIAAWRRICDGGPTAVACWRGGLRSRLAQEFIGRTEVARVEGGYKALRGFLMAALEPALAERRPLVLGGLTGSGKSELLAELGDVPGLLPLDLEAAAHHRGSAFGAQGEQPSQQSFENALAARLRLDRSPWLLLEDESRYVGRRQLPAPLYALIAGGPLLLLEAPLAERIERIHRQYVLEPAAVHGVEAVLRGLEANVLRLKRRLGGATVTELAAVVRAAGEAEAWREAGAFEAVIRPLLEAYYDPLYRKAVSRLDRQVWGRGDKETLLTWLRTRT